VKSLVRVSLLLFMYMLVSESTSGSPSWFALERGAGDKLFR
jgi:hypothetical protein